MTAARPYQGMEVGLESWGVLSPGVSVPLSGPCCNIGESLMLSALDPQSEDNGQTCWWEKNWGGVRERG